MEFIFEIFNYTDQLIINNYIFALLLFCLFIYLYSTFSLPGMLLIWLFSGYAFDVYTAFIISSIFTTLGSLNLFLLSRTIFHSFFKIKFQKYIQKISNKIQKNSYELLIVFRLSPINIPFFLQNVALSFLEISFVKYIVTTFLGLSPTILFITIIGNAMSRIDNLKDFEFNYLLNKDFIILYTLILFIILLRIFIKYNKGKN